MLIGVVVGFTILYCTNLFNAFFQGEFLESLLKVIEIAGFCIWVFSMFRIGQIKLLIRKNPDLKAALKNEWILHNLQKARSIAFFFIFFSLIISGVLCMHSPISPLFLIKLCILIGILAVLISFIFFNRERKDG